MNWKNALKGAKKINVIGVEVLRNLGGNGRG